MALIITAEERLSAPSSVKGVIVGPAKIGKTSQVKTLIAAGFKPLVIDMEAGMLALDDCEVDSINVRKAASEFGVHPWDFLRDLACIVAGPNPAVTQDEQVYSFAHHAHCLKTYGARDALLGGYDTLFYDSITDTSRICFSWSKTQPEAFSEKTGKPDTRGAYGLLGQEMVGGNGMFNQLKHTSDLNIILVGLLNEVTDDYKRTTFVPQVEGNKTKDELAGIFDQIITFTDIDFGKPAGRHRAFVCRSPNQWGYPAGDRSGRLDLIEEPDLGKLLRKIKGGPRSQEIVTSLPATEE